MRYMFTMMNNARLSVGLEGLALGRAGLPAGLAYAKERVQGRAVGRRAGRAVADRRAPRRAPDAAHDEGLRSRRCAALMYLNAGGDRPRQHAPRRGSAQARAELADLLTPIVQGLVHRPRRRARLARRPGPRRHGLHRGDRAPPSTTATPASPRSTRAPTASRPWTSSAASSRSRTAPSWPA